eukprot:jgi/Antlo1/1425/1392
MLIIVTIIVIAIVVASIEKTLLKMSLQEHAHNQYYPFPSYSRQRYYRKITFSEDNRIEVYDNFKRIQQIKKPSLSIDGKSPFLNIVKNTMAKKTPLRIAECRKIPGVLVYTDNTKSPTHVFCTNRHVSDIINSGKCDIENEIVQISKSIVNSKRWSLNQLGLIMLIVNLEYMQHVVWGKHGDYIVGWNSVDPIILIHIGDEAKNKLKKFHKKNLTLSSMLMGEWDKTLFLCTIENSRMRLMVKHNTPKNIFVVHFRKELCHLGDKSYTRLRKEDKELVNKTKRDMHVGNMLHREAEDRECFGNELSLFLHNLKEFVSDGTCFRLLPPDE